MYNFCSDNKSRLGICQDKLINFGFLSFSSSSIWEIRIPLIIKLCPILIVYPIHTPLEIICKNKNTRDC